MSARALDFGGPREHPFEAFPSEALESSISERFERIAEANWDRLAVCDSGVRLRYSEVAALVNRIAGAVDAIHGDPGEPVGLLMSYRAVCPAAMLGVLRAGRFYLPLDPRSPVERNRFIVRHSGVRVLLADEAHLDMARELGPEVVSIGDADGRPPALQPSPESLAYILYTSGSTGRPKGAYQNHRNLLFDVMQFVNSVHLSRADRMTWLYSPSVNGSIRDIYGALLTGATLYAHPVAVEGFQALENLIGQEGITIYHSVPILFRKFLGTLNRGQILDSIRLAYLAGDRLDPSDVELFRSHFPRGSYLYTGIGSTEIATLYRQWFIDHDSSWAGSAVPVGWQTPDRDSLIADDGQIVVRGRHLALGYWREPELTSERFRVVECEPGVTEFHTGDAGRMRPDGMLDFLGRIDYQAKIRGHRVELAEIERTAKEAPGVTEAAAVLRGEQLWLYFTGEADLPGGAPVVRKFLESRLPPQMVPHKLQRLDQLPMLGSYKIDRVALAEIEEPDSLAGNPQPQGLVERAVQEIFEASLKCPAGPDDDFFTLGGDSLKAIVAAIDLGKRLNRPVEPRAIVSGRTVRGVAEFVKNSQLAKLQDGEGDPLILVPAVSDHLTGLPQIGRWFRGRPVYVLYHAWGHERGEQPFCVLATSMCEAILASGVEGPYSFLGFCYGGRLAFEMARQLTAAGKQVAWLGILDSTPTGWLAQGMPTLDGVRGKIARRIWRMRRISPRDSLRDAFESVRFRVARLWRYARLRGRAPAAARLERLMNKRRDQSLAAYVRYQPRYWDGDVHLFRAEGLEFGWAERPEDLGWKQWCRTVKVTRVTGMHRELPPETFRRAAEAMEAELRLR